MTQQDSPLSSDEKTSATGQQLHINSTDLALLHALRRPKWRVNYEDSSREWRRFFAEIMGTFMLVVVAAGGGLLSAQGVGISRIAAVVAPGLVVMAIILSIGTISGAHLNPVVTFAFALRSEFPWRRIPLYLVAQCVGAICACLFLRAMFGDVGALGATLPGHGISNLHAMYMEILLTFGLITVILGTASHAQNVGPLSALAAGGYVALAGMWASPISGASMNPARSFGPDVVAVNYSHLWVYLAGPAIGMLLAVGAALILRGKGGQEDAIAAAQGTLDQMEAAEQVIEAAHPSA